MKLGKTIGIAALGALALAAVPYRIEKKDDGTLEVRSLLWGLRKTPGAQEEDGLRILAFPGSKLDSADEKVSQALARRLDAKEAAEEAAVEEAVPEEPAAVEAPIAEAVVAEPAAAEAPRAEAAALESAVEAPAE